MLINYFRFVAAVPDRLVNHLHAHQILQSDDDDKPRMGRPVAWKRFVSFRGGRLIEHFLLRFPTHFNSSDSATLLHT